MSHYLIELANTITIYRTDGHIEPGVTGPYPSLKAAKAAIPAGGVYTVCELEPEVKPLPNPSRNGYRGGIVKRTK